MIPAPVRYVWLVAQGDDRPPVALVSGAASGIGRAVLKALTADGNLVVAGWRRTPPDWGASVQFDTTDAREVESAVARVEEQWGPIAVVVAGSGMSRLDLAVHVPAERFRNVVDVNLTGAFLLARTALRPMLRRRRGRIVLIGSAAGVAGVAGVAPYAAAKAGLAAVARTMALEAGARGVTVNVVAPGMLDDAEHRLADRRPGQEVAQRWLDRTPVGRTGAADEVAAAVRYLASPRARSVTGAVLPVDGGYVLAALPTARVSRD